MIITSTHGEGDPPQPGKPFFEFLESRKAPKLTGKRFAVVALGDSTYERFCEAGRRIDRRFEELGATRIAPCVECDVDYDDAAANAIAGTLAALQPEQGRLEGFNVAIGGSMGRTDQAPKTHPRLADVIGFVPVDWLLTVIDAVMTVQRDYGDRMDRSHARFKYTIDDKGLPWIKDVNGRIIDSPGLPLMEGLRAIAQIHRGTFRLTPNQNLIVVDIKPDTRPTIEALLAKHRLSDLDARSGLKLNSMACVALPTCGLAMAESERYSPHLLSKIETILSRHGLHKEPITIRMSGCPNGCSRPYIAEIGLTGRAPGKYNHYFGGGFHGQRLNKMYLENVGEGPILAALDKVIAHFTSECRPDEHFGDFAIRAGYVPEVKEGKAFND